MQSLTKTVVNFTTMRNKTFLLTFIITVALLSSCTKEELLTLENDSVGIDLVNPTKVEEIDTIHLGLYLGKKVTKETKETKETILNGNPSIIKSP
jgi:hypothetical protein